VISAVNGGITRTDGHTHTRHVFFLIILWRKKDKRKGKKKEPSDASRTVAPHLMGTGPRAQASPVLTYKQVKIVLAR
jgi:hypothetical protein